MTVAHRSSLPLILCAYLLIAWKRKIFYARNYLCEFFVLCKAGGYRFMDSHFTEQPLYTALFSDKTEICLHLKKTRCLKIAQKLLNF